MEAMTMRILVWDVPTRVFHWLLALSFAAAFVTGDSERWRDIHVAAGYTMMGLIGFRLVWGITGTRYARFSSFLFGPRAVVRYLGSLLRGRPEHHVGHNPAGSVAIVLMLLLGLLAGATGYLAYVYDVEWMGELHEALVNGLLAVVGVHVAGVVVSSLLHGENLVRAMITGRKTGEPRQGIRRGHAWVGAVLVAAVIAFWYQSAGDVAAGGPVAQLEHSERHATRER
jgi:cytochrome b